MKRWIHASVNDQARKINNAKRELAKYDEKKIKYVRECMNEIMNEISRHYTEEEQLDYDDVIGISLSAIKTDYMLGAIEDDLMTEEEFEDIYNLLDVIDLEMAQSYA